MSYNAGHGNGQLFVANAVRESKDPGAINRLYTRLMVEDLSENKEERQQQIYTAFKDTYETEKTAFEKSKTYVGYVKNGTYPRRFEIKDPDSGCSFRIEIRMQRYKKKEDKSSFAFYGSLFLPRIPVPLVHLITMFAERVSELSERAELPRSQWQSLTELCKSWKIRVKAFYFYWKKVQVRFFHDEGAKGMVDWLHHFHYSVAQSA